MKTTYCSFILSILLIFSCGPVSEPAESSAGAAANEKTGEGEVKNGLVRMEQDGIVKEINYVNGKKTGLSTQYYKNGKLHIQVEYVDNIKNGLSKWYYQEGGLYEEIPYVNGEKEGMAKYYYPDGKLKAEIPFKNGKAGIGAKEYNKNGKELSTSDLIFEEVDRLALADEFILRVKFKDHKRNAKYYVGELTDGKYLNHSLHQLSVKDGIGEVSFYLPKGMFQMEKFNFVGEYSTRDKTPIIKQKTYNLSIENR